MDSWRTLAAATSNISRRFFFGHLSEHRFVLFEIPGAEKFPALLKSGLIECFGALIEEIEFRGVVA